MAPLRFGFKLKVVNVEGTFKRKKGPANLPHACFAVFHSDGSAVYFWLTIQRRGGGAFM